VYAGIVYPAGRAVARNCPRELTSTPAATGLHASVGPWIALRERDTRAASATVESRAEMDATGSVLREVSPYKSD
jgi:hypothetical protein